MFEQQKCYPATISTQTTVNNFTKLFFASNAFLNGKTITGISVYPFESNNGEGVITGLQLFGTQAPFQFTSLITSELNNEYRLNLLDNNDEIVLKDVPLLSFVNYPDPTGQGVDSNRQQMFKLKNINLEKSYITGGMAEGKGIYFIFNYL